ncbi:uncharacterized protein LOC122266273 isoform X1 [Penaeus japonicus]|nr:uncharacterized protein LOC122266273 isoform X1 [Penaeus japonicus]
MDYYHGRAWEYKRSGLSGFQSRKGIRSSLHEESNEDNHSQYEEINTDDSDTLGYSNEDLDNLVDSIPLDDSCFQSNVNAPDSAPVISFMDKWESWLKQSTNRKDDSVAFNWFLADNTDSEQSIMGYSLKYCESCETYFTKNHDYQQHLKFCIIYPVCKVCKMTFRNRSKLHKHIVNYQHMVKEIWERVTQAQYVRLCREGRVFTNNYLSVKQRPNKRALRQKWQGQGKGNVMRQHNSISSKPPVNVMSESSFSGTVESYSDVLEKEAKKSSQEKLVTDVLNRVDTKSLQTDGCNKNEANKTEIRKENMPTKRLHTLFFCQMCNTYFIYLQTFKNHKGNCKGKNTCMVCFQSFQNFKLLLNHIREEKHAVQQETAHIIASHKTFRRLLRTKRIAPCDVSKYQTVANEKLNQLSGTPVSEMNIEETSVEENTPKEMIVSEKCDETILWEKDSLSKEKSEIVSKGCITEGTSEHLPGDKQIIKAMSVEKEVCADSENCQDMLDGVRISKEEFAMGQDDTMDDHIKQSPVSPSDSGCQMDDICHDIDGPFIGLDIKEEVLEESVNTSFQDVEREKIGEAFDINIKEERDKCSTLPNQTLKRKQSYKPLPKSVKIARLEHKTDSLTKYLEVQRHPERQVRCIKLRLRTENCPGCMESVDARSAVLNTVTLEVSMWCKTCAWNILFTDFFHP